MECVNALELTDSCEEREMRFYSNGKDLNVVVQTRHHKKGERDIMARLVENGVIPQFMPTSLRVDVYYDHNGDCIERFNPTVKHKGCNLVFNGGWILEATPENERRIIEEIQRQYNEERGRQ